MMETQKDKNNHREKVYFIKKNMNMYYVKKKKNSGGHFLISAFQLKIYTTWLGWKYKRIKEYIQIDGTFLLSMAFCFYIFLLSLKWSTMQSGMEILKKMKIIHG